MSSTAMPEQTTDAAFQTMHMQLERMRAMHYKYSDLFYKLIIISLIVIILMAVASLTETLRATVLMIPFFTIWVGVQSAYFLTYTTFARVYATGIEQRINQLLKRDILIAHRIEASFLFPLAGPQFAGVPARFGQTFIGFLTLHFWILGTAIIGLSTYRAWQLLPELEPEFAPAGYYLWALTVWAVLHLVYLVWYFGTRRYDQAIMNIVSEAYGADYESA